MPLGNKIVALGEALYELVPYSGGGALSDVSIFTRNAGGAPANVTIAICKLGGGVRFIGKIGQDPFGQFIRHEMVRYGAEVALATTREAKTGITFIALDADGGRSFTFCNEPPADMLLQEQELQAEWLADAAYFYFGSRSLVRPNSRAATAFAAERIRAADGIVAFDPNIRLSLWSSAESARRITVEHLPLADVVSSSREELELLFPGLDPDRAVREIIDMGVRLVIVTSGAEGCRIISEHIDIRVPAFEVTAVDSTGAGDSFMGAVLYMFQKLNILRSELAEYISSPAALHEIFVFGSAVGALTTTRYGAIAALPSYAEVMEFMRSNKQPLLD